MTFQSTQNYPSSNIGNWDITKQVSFSKLGSFLTSMTMGNATSCQTTVASLQPFYDPMLLSSKDATERSWASSSFPLRTIVSNISHTNSNGFIFPSTREHKILSKTPCRNHQTSLDELESLPPFTYSRLMRLLPVPHDGHGWNGPLYSTTAGRQWFPASHGVSWKEIQKQRISTWKNFIDHNGLEVGEFLRMFYLYL